MLTHGGAEAVLAFASYAAVFTDRSAAAALAHASYAAVLTDGGAATAVTFASFTSMLTDGGAATARTRASSAAVLTDACPPAFSAPFHSAVVRALLANVRHFSSAASLAYVSTCADGAGGAGLEQQNSVLCAHSFMLPCEYVRIATRRKHLATLKKHLCTAGKSG